VEKPYQKRHIGMDLLDHAMKYARERGAKTIALVTMYYRFNWFKNRGFRTLPRKDLPDALRDHWTFTAQRYMKCAAMIVTVGDP
jgi:N-acetylglutamate synthase-like GNAT family acetyltransferase